MYVKTTNQSMRRWSYFPKSVREDRVVYETIGRGYSVVGSQDCTRYHG